MDSSAALPERAASEQKTRKSLKKSGKYPKTDRNGALKRAVYVGESLMEVHGR
jgi:hypothetical protein